MRVSMIPLLVLALAAGACGSKKDRATPLAAASATLSSTRVPLGSPVDITYKFEIAQSARFDKDYRVLVHFLDADEEMMWADDHMPPVPTSSWKGGQTVEYSRTLFVPLYPYVGEAAVVVGLYDPATAARLPLSGDALGQREYRVARFRLQPQSDNIFLAYLEGWHGPETAADNPAVEWQWTKREAVLRFRNPRKNAVFYLHYDGRPAMFDSPQAVTVWLRDEVIDAFQVATANEEIRKVPLKAAQFGTDDVVVCRISVDKTFVPSAANAGSRDTRELGIRVFHAFVAPQ